MGLVGVRLDELHADIGITTIRPCGEREGGENESRSNIRGH